LPNQANAASKGAFSERGAKAGTLGGAENPGLAADLCDGRQAGNELSETYLPTAQNTF